MTALTNLTALHVSNLQASLKFYQRAFGFKELHRIENSSYTSSFIGLDSPEQPNYGKPVFSRDGIVELRQDKKAVKIYNGNTDPYRGYGHLCISVGNIAEAQKALLADGVTFRKKLEDGRQHDIIFVQDPDTYWIELIENGIRKSDNKYDLTANRMNHTMIRVKDPAKSLKFYQGVLGMQLFHVSKFPDAKFTLYFLGYDDSPDFKENTESLTHRASRQSIIEMTHNWGTETQSDFSYYTFGKDEGIVGFDHFGVTIPEAAKFCSKLHGNANVLVKYNTEIKDTAVLADPDGWKVYVH